MAGISNGIMRVCKARKGVKDLPILAQGLPAFFLIRRLYGGLAGLSVDSVAGLPR